MNCVIIRIYYEQCIKFIIAPASGVSDHKRHAIMKRHSFAILKFHVSDVTKVHETIKNKHFRSEKYALDDK